MRCLSRPWSLLPRSSARIHALPRRAQPRAARGRAQGGRPAAHPRRRRVWQDTRHHLPHRLPRRRGLRRAERGARRHLHQQGGRGDAGPRRAAARRCLRRHVDLDLPLHVRAPAAPRGAGHRPVSRLRHLRLLRPGRPSSSRRCSDLHIDDSFLQPRAALSRISHAKNQMEAGPEAVAGSWNPTDAEIAEDLRAVPGARSRTRTRSTSTTCC